jgi:hypothetical protein
MRRLDGVDAGGQADRRLCQADGPQGGQGRPGGSPGGEEGRQGRAVAHAAVAVAKAAYKYSGAQDVVSCVTNPHLSSCIKAAVTVALVVATAGEGEVEVAAMEAAEEGGADVAEQVGAKAAESYGLSFTPGTKVLLASGKAVPISSLKPGEKVISTSTKTGKTQPGTTTAAKS